MNGLRNKVAAKAALTQWLGLTAILAVLAGAMAYDLYRDHAKTAAREEKKLADLAQVIAENMEFQLHGINHALEDVRSEPEYWSASTGRGRPLSLTVLGEAMSSIRTINILDAKGTTIASNRPELIGQNFADRDYFQIAKRHSAPGTLHVSPPFRTVLGVFTLNVVRTIHRPDGTFAGIVSATLDPDYFRTLMKSVLYAPDMWDAIAHGDGLMFLMEPEKKGLPGTNLAKPGTLFTRHRDSGRVASVFTDRVYVTGDMRIAAIRTLQPKSLGMDKPLVIAINRNLDAVFEAWRRDALHEAIFFGLLVLISVLGLHRYQRRQRQFEATQIAAEDALARSAERLELATQAAGIGIWDYDIASGELAWDRLMSDLYGIADTGASLRYDTWRNAVLPEDLPATEQTLNASMTQGTPFHHCFRIRRGDGAIHHIEARGKVFFDKVGQPVRMVGTNEDITERHEMEAELREAQRIARLGSWRFDMASKRISWTEEVYRMMGIDPELPPPDHIEHKNLLAPASWEGLSSGLARAMESGDPYELELEVVKPGGGHGWILGRGEAVRDADGTVVGLRGISMDITERKRNEIELEKHRHHLEQLVEERTAALHEAETKYRTVADFTYDWEIWKDPEGRLIYCSPSCERISGHTADEFLANPELFIDIVHPDDLELFQKHYSAFGKQHPFEMLTYRIKCPDGRIVWIEHACQPVFDEKLGYLGRRASNRDITLRKQAEDALARAHEEALHNLAFYDALTGLPNRRLLLDRLRQSLPSSSRKQHQGAILFIDLDDFKTLNDTRGHDVGDLLLVEIARRLQTCVHADDTLAHVGSDEFVVVLDALSTEAEQAARQAESIALRIHKAITQPFALQGEEYLCKACIGISLFREYETRIEDLLKRSDAAMFQAKQTGRNKIHFFDAGMQAALETRVQLESWLRVALPDQFRLHYQAQVDGHGNIFGAEALIRWQHPEKGMISPVEFIPLAEDTGLILPIGRWVLETACRQLKAWETSPHARHLLLAVNVSARQFHQADFVDQVLDVLSQTGADPLRLKLELTESMLVEDVDIIIKKMTVLKARGVRFSLDDFGTGFSSLSYLKRLPLDQLKIDQSFVRDLATDPNDAAIVRTVIALGQSLGLAVIAEGVETEEQRNFLAVHGCGQYQGYLFGRPVPLDEFERSLARR